MLGAIRRFFRRLQEERNAQKAAEREEQLKDEIWNFNAGIVLVENQEIYVDSFNWISAKTTFPKSKKRLSIEAISLLRSIESKKKGETFLAGLTRYEIKTSHREVFVVWAPPAHGLQFLTGDELKSCVEARHA